MSWRPNPRACAQTSVQSATLRFGLFLDSSRLELSEREFDVFLEILTARIAREHRLRLERDELRRRRAA